MEFSFMEQMEENTGFSLIYPYHVDFDKLIGNDFYNKDYPDAFHCHSFEEVLQKAYREPRAFYLTGEDVRYYSTQEIEFIQKVIKDETRKLDEGFEIVTLNLNDDVMDMLIQYKLENNMTFEEAVIMS